MMMPTHIDCWCEKKKKKRELGFILVKRAKVGTTGPHQTVSADLQEHRKLVKTKVRRFKEEDNII